MERPPAGDTLAEDSIEADPYLNASDTQLWALMQDGEQQATRVFVERHLGAVAAGVLAGARRFPYYAQEWAAEASQNAWLNVLDRARKPDQDLDFETYGSAAPWLRSTAAYKVRDQAKAKQKNMQHLDHNADIELLGDNAYDTTDPLREVLDSQQPFDLEASYPAIAKSLQALPTVSSSLLTLLFVEGLSHQQAAARLGLTYTNERARYSRAIRSLRQACQINSR